jgi:methyl-accepting chemotaxis protein
MLLPTTWLSAARHAARWTPQGLLEAIDQLREELREEIRIMSDSITQELQQLVQNVQRLTDANASAEALLKGLHDSLDAALANAQNAGVDPQDLQELHDLNSQIAARTNELAQAVVQNTPAASGGGATGATGGTAQGGDTGATGDTSTPAP